MSLQTWQETLMQSQIDGTAVTTATPGASLLPPAAVLTLPANWWAIGRVLKIKILGRVSNRVTGPDTLTINVRYGAIQIAASQAIPINVLAKTNVSFILEWLLTCRSIGNSTLATCMHQGLFTSESVIGAPLPAAGGQSTMLIPASAPAVGTGFDSTVAGTIDVFAFWSTGAVNSIMSHQYTLESMN
jgi:hypothetical protein